MPIISDLTVDVRVDEMLRGQEAVAQRPEIQDLARAAAEEAVRLARPTVIYDWVPIRMAEEGDVVLGDARLHVGPHAGLLAEAREALVAVITLGPALEKRVHELSAEARLLESYLLDCAGVVALGSGAAPILELVDAATKDRGWGLSPAVQPGSLPGWPITDQHAVCSVLDIGSIGVTVTPAGLLLPQKSFSIVIGIGPAYSSHTVSSTCHLCQLQRTCPRRHWLE